MLKLPLTGAQSSPRTVLCLGAHCDDIEIGCGATVLRVIREVPSIDVWWVTFSGTEQRKREAEAGAAAFLAGADKPKVLFYSYPDGYFPYVGGEIKGVFEELKKMVVPDLVLTHYHGDAHQDHRMICELTWNTFRDNLILEYEIPKYDGDLGAPNLFVELSREDCERKIDYLRECYGTQRSKDWFSDETFWALLRLRGVEARSRSGYAEAFYCKKMVV